MKFTVNRLLMYQAVKTVLKIVRPNKEIPELGGLLIEADESSGMLTITGTDIRTHIQRRLRLEHIEESGGMILKPILAEMLYLLTDEFVELESEKNLDAAFRFMPVYHFQLSGKKLSKTANSFPGGYHSGQGD